MSLVVWLPLTKDLRQQGLSNTIATNHGTTYQSTGGKLGGCYYFSGSTSSYISTNYQTNIGTSDFSISLWIKIPTMTSGSYYAICTSKTTGAASTGFGIYWNYSQKKFLWSTADGSTATEIWMANTVDTIVYDKWIHLVMVRNSSDAKKGYFYINGVRYELASVPAIRNITTASNLYLGMCTNSNYAAKMYLNDFRIYDHALSQMEVKELAKGLVLHYSLNRQGLGPSNLIKNGFGELGTENWTSSTNISTTDIPASQSDIKISVTNNYTVERIKIYPTHTYKFSTWIKATTTSGYTYPSLFPYDVDGKFIDYYKCSDSFNLNTMTTLKQQLTTGDTKIYVNDLSQWNTNSGHYYNWAAIFSYTDGTGYTYPDGTYTQNLGRFGTSTNAKTNLDKTNNIITLTTAYTGPTMPIGTKLCASTEGSAYYYPLGGINLANIQDWTYKEGTFSASTARLKYAKEVMFWTYTNNRMAGIKLQDLTNENLDTTTEYDCSGFCNNGTRTGTFTWTSNTAKYAVSTKFNGTDNAIQTPSLPTMITDKNYTIAVWIYKTVIGSKGYQTIYGGPSGFEIEARNGSANETKFVPWNWGKPMASYELNEWNHCVFVHSDTDCKIYLNGEYIATGTAKASNPTGNYFVGAWNTATQQNFDGLMSDFRIYATALSADDVKSLYQNCATIDPDGTIRGQIRS